MRARPLAAVPDARSAGCHLRCSEVGEIIGTDEDQLGEFAYDFAMINRDLEGNFDLSDVKSGKGEKYESPSASSNGVPQVEPGTSEKENTALDQRGGMIGTSSNNPMGGPSHVRRFIALKSDLMRGSRRAMRPTPATRLGSASAI